MTSHPTPAHGAGPTNAPSANPDKGLALRLDDRARARYERTARMDMALAMSQADDGYVSLRQGAGWWQR